MIEIEKFLSLIAEAETHLEEAEKCLEKCKFDEGKTKNLREKLEANDKRKALVVQTILDKRILLLETLIGLICRPDLSYYIFTGIPGISIRVYASNHHISYQKTQDAFSSSYTVENYIRKKLPFHELCVGLAKDLSRQIHNLPAEQQELLSEAQKTLETYQTCMTEL